MGSISQLAGRGFAGLALLGAFVASGTAELVASSPAGAANPAPSGELSWGAGGYGQLGNGTTTGAQTTPVTVSLPAGVTAKAIAAGGDTGYAIGSDGNLYAWGAGRDGELGNGTFTLTQTTPVTVNLPTGVTAKAIAAGAGTGYAIGSDGNLYAWGAGDGALGNGVTASTNTPVTVSLPAGVTAKAIAAGIATGYAIGSDGNLYAWGAGDSGQLGNGTTPTEQYTPVTVSLPAGVTAKAIAAGGDTGYAIGSDGNLYAWGDGGAGKLGNGTMTAAQTTPVTVSLPEGVTAKAITAGINNAYAIGSDGNLYAWGFGDFGGLGNGTTTLGQTTPVTVSFPAGVTAKTIAAGAQTGYAIGSDGNLYGWGLGDIGQLGNGTTTNIQTTPVTVSLPAGAVPTGLGTESEATTGYALVSATPPPPVTTSPSQTPPHGYWLVGSDGGIFSFGAAQFYGSTGSLVLQRPVVGIVPTKDDGGYWLDASDGGVFSFGDTQFYGSIPGLGLHPAGSGLPHSLNAPIVGMVPSIDDNGYFMVASDGGVFAFGDAHFAGSCPGIGGCAGAAVAVMPDASGNGYWLVTQTGNVYTFGDAPYFGAPGHGTVTSAVATPDGKGYWVLLSDGEVFGYGDAGNLGYPSSDNFYGPDAASAIFATSDGAGYWVSSALGAVFNYGDAPNDGGMSATHLNGSIIAATGF